MSGTGRPADVVAFEHVTKKFLGVTALDDVSFAVQGGTCHALLGENGAGKSTLGKILVGHYRPDAGRVLLDGRPVVFHSPRDAVTAGVGIVHQELVFCPNLSVAENLCLHDLPRRGLRLDRRQLEKLARARLAQVGLAIDVWRPLASLSIAEEQMVQIAAAVGLGARVLVFDEPTSSLTRDQVDRLFDLVRRLRAQGTTIIYVSHRLEEIFELCQAVTVLRDGRHVATRPIGELDHDRLVRLMVGRELGIFAPPAAPLVPGPPRIGVRGFSSPGKFEGVDLEVRAGEIVGLAGLVGAGRTEIAEAIFGLDRHARGQIQVDGRPARVDRPAQAMRLGIGLVPEDRKRRGLILGMTVRENITLPILDRFRGWLGRARRQHETQVAEEYCKTLAVRAPGVETPVAALSGGNQQKVVLAKGISTGTKVLIVDEPTRGVDVGAKREIHELIGRLARDGLAVLLISSELPELLALADRLLVLRAGRIVGHLSREEATPDIVLRHMAGIESGQA